MDFRRIRWKTGPWKTNSEAFYRISGAMWGTTRQKELCYNMEKGKKVETSLRGWELGGCVLRFKERADSVVDRSPNDEVHSWIRMSMWRAGKVDPEPKHFCTKGMRCTSYTGQLEHEVKRDGAHSTAGCWFSWSCGPSSSWCYISGKSYNYKSGPLLVSVLYW